MLPLICVILSSSLKRVLKDQAAQAVTAAIDHAVQPINLHNNDSLLHGPFADIDLARMTVNAGHVTTERVQPENSYSAVDTYAQIKEELKDKKRFWANMSDSDIGAEDAYLLAMEPLTMCRSQARQSKDLEKCMYCSCTRCGRPNVTGQLITFIKDSI